MARIDVEAGAGGSYRVRVVEAAGAVHDFEVSVSVADLRRYGAGVDAERLIEASFAFLLEREPASAILSRFDLPVIERYFPEYPRVIRERLGGGTEGAG